MTIFEIDEQLRNCIDEETGEFFEDKFNELTMAREQKIEGMCLLIKEKLAMALAITEEINTLKTREERLEKECDRIKELIGYCLNGEKFETSKVKCSWRKSESVNISDESIIPQDYIKTKITTTPDKTAIKAAIKEGTIIPGAELVEKLNLKVT